MKKLGKRLKKEDKKIKEIIKIISDKHNYTWEVEGKKVSLYYIRYRFYLKAIINYCQKKILGSLNTYY